MENPTCGNLTHGRVGFYIESQIKIKAIAASKILSLHSFERRINTTASSIISSEEKPPKIPVGLFVCVSRGFADAAVICFSGGGFCGSDGISFIL